MKHFWNTKLAIIFFIVGLFSYTISAQKITRFSNKEGFNQNTINTISKDKYGFLWFGTPNGLIRYDGYDFKTFSSQANYKERVESTNVKFLFNDDNGVLWIGTNPWACLLTLLTLVFYLLIYTPLKKRSPYATEVGAVSGALPPLIGWVAASGEPSLYGWILFGILFTWQLPHFMAIAWNFRKDYEQGGFKLQNLGSANGFHLARKSLIYSFLLTGLIKSI